MSPVKETVFYSCVDVDTDVLTPKSVDTLYYCFTCSVTHHAYIVYVENCQIIKLIMKAFNINIFIGIFIFTHQFIYCYIVYNGIELDFHI